MSRAWDGCLPDAEAYIHKELPSVLCSCSHRSVPWPIMSSDTLRKRTGRHVQVARTGTERLYDDPEERILWFYNCIAAVGAGKRPVPWGLPADAARPKILPSQTATAGVDRRSEGG